MKPSKKLKFRIVERRRELTSDEAWDRRGDWEGN